MLITHKFISQGFFSNSVVQNQRLSTVHQWISRSYDLPFPRVIPMLKSHLQGADYKIFSHVFLSPLSSVWFIMYTIIYIYLHRQHIKNQRHYFANKGPSSQGYGFSSSHVWMSELDCEESWALKNWCFWTVVLEKILESPLDCKEIQPVHLKISPGCSLEGMMLKLILQSLATSCEELTHCKRLGCWEGLGAGGKGDNRGWDGWMAAPTRWRGFGWTLGVGDGQGGLACCYSWGHRVEPDWVTELNWTEHICMCVSIYIHTHIFKTFINLMFLLISYLLYFGDCTLHTFFIANNN